MEELQCHRDVQELNERTLDPTAVFGKWSYEIRFNLWEKRIWKEIEISCFFLFCFIGIRFS